jgi:hypothetical protein
MSRETVSLRVRAFVELADGRPGQNVVGEWHNGCPPSRETGENELLSTQKEGKVWVWAII